jgi:hypothetical protein
MPNKLQATRFKQHQSQSHHQENHSANDVSAFQGELARRFVDSPPEDAGANQESFVKNVGRWLRIKAGAKLVATKADKKLGPDK